jgi:LPS sulfotransferase NodH
MFPDRSLMVCANQRTGSTMLCRALTDTQVAGHPDEYFPTVDPVQSPQLRCWEDGSGMSRTAYLRSVYR